MDFVDLEAYAYSIAVGDEYFYVGKQFAPFILSLLIQSGGVRVRFSGHSGSVLSVFLSGNILVSGSTDKNVICWNPITGNIIRTLKGHNDAVYTVGLFDGNVYSGGADRVVLKWNIDNGEIAKKFDVFHFTLIWCFAYRPAELFTGSIDTSVIRWNVTSGVRLSRYVERIKKLRAIAAWKYYVMSAGEDLRINVWDASVNGIEPVVVLLNHTRAINCLAVYDEYLYSGSSDDTVKQWNLTQFTLNKIYEGHRDTIVSVTVDQSFVYASGFLRDIYQWNASSSVLAGRFEGHSDDVDSLKLSSNLLFSGSKDRTIRAWNIQSRETVKIFNG
jgi:WD40 repeat protein